MTRRGPLAAFFAFGFFWGGWAALVPAIQDAVGASKGELGLALLFVAIGSLPSMRGGRNATPEERGRAVATVTTIGYLGFLVGPPLVGGTAEAVGLRAAFAALALVAIALVIATPRLGLSRKSA